jgi:hypothetical protein
MGDEWRYNPSTRQIGDFTQPNVARGRITNYRTGDFVNFHLNPSAINEKKGVNLVEDSIPGGSQGLLRWASSKTGVITFSLDLDAEISLRKRGRNMINFAEDDTVDDTQRYSVDAECEFFTAFQFPVDPAILGRSAEPDKALFTFGRAFAGVLCVVESVDIAYREFSPTLCTTKAKVDLTLKRYAVETVFANQVYDYQGSVL